MLGDNMALAAYQQINDDFTVNETSFYESDSFVQDDHGTSHTSVIAPNGDAVSATSSINYKWAGTVLTAKNIPAHMVISPVFDRFGAALLSQSTGVILNDQMDDFSSPNITNVYGVEPSRENRIRPGKRPLKSMCPTIIVDKNGDAVLVLGAAGGTMITTAIAQVIVTCKKSTVLVMKFAVYQKNFPKPGNHQEPLVEGRHQVVHRLGEDSSPVDPNEGGGGGVRVPGNKRFFVLAGTCCRASNTLCGGSRHFKKKRQDLRKCRLQEGRGNCWILISLVVLFVCILQRSEKRCRSQELVLLSYLKKHSAKTEYVFRFTWISVSLPSLLTAD